jgi:hypothetical protein
LQLFGEYIDDFVNILRAQAEFTAFANASTQPLNDWASAAALMKLP